MINSIFEMFSLSFYNVSEWFTDILSASGASGLVLGMITLYLVVRFLVSPLTGAGSDKVTKRKKESDG